MRTDCKEVKRYSVVAQLTGLYILGIGIPDFEGEVNYQYTSDTVYFIFRDKNNNQYTHAQLSPGSCRPNQQSRAFRYLANITQAHNLQSPIKMNVKDLHPDMTTGTVSQTPVGSYFTIEVCERTGVNKKYGKRIYRNADYVSDLPPSKKAIEEMKIYECSDEYKDMVLKRKRWEKDQLEYANRRFQDWESFYKEVEK